MITFERNQAYEKFNLQNNRKKYFRNSN